MARRDRTATDEEEDRLAPAWRRWRQAAEAFDQADEAEEFQAVGVRCREALLALVCGIATPSVVPVGQQAPLKGDFIHWSELIADAIAPGPSSAEVRGYLKALGRTAWQLVGRVTHSSNAVRFDGHMAVDATQNTLSAFGAALIRHERPAPDRCPKCSSYRITSVYRPETGIDPPYFPLCESCGWTEGPDDA